MKDTERNRKLIKRKVWEIRHRGYIETSNGTYSLSPRGKQVVNAEKLRALAIRIPRKWDGVWHIVVFDIPQEKAVVRISFIRHLQRMGLVYYQRSVWIHPYEMEDEVREIAAFFGLLPFIAFIKAPHVDQSYDLRKHFKLI